VHVFGRQAGYAGMLKFFSKSADANNVMFIGIAKVGKLRKTWLLAGKGVVGI